MWEAALRPPAELMTLPYTAGQEEVARCFVSLLLRPLVCPAAGADPAKTMEIRFLAPGSLVSNLDFVESIFGNGGDPYLPENDAGLDVWHWTGHTGCVVLAPHIVGLPKKALGLPHYDVATERQRRDGMCWQEEAEPYNEGRAFKVVCRDARGLMVTVIADNYFGYCKKEVKTQISFAANLYGACEEEHAGGALAFATYVLGTDFFADRTVSLAVAPFARCDAHSRATWSSCSPKATRWTGAFRTCITCPSMPTFTLARASCAGRMGTANRGCRCAWARCISCPRASG